MYNEAVIRACIQQLRFWYTLKNQLAADNSQGAQDQEIKALKTFMRARDANVAYFLIPLYSPQREVRAYESFITQSTEENNNLEFIS